MVGVKMNNKLHNFLKDIFPVENVYLLICLSFLIFYSIQFFVNTNNYVRLCINPVTFVLSLVLWFSLMICYVPPPPSYLGRIYIT